MNMYEMFLQVQGEIGGVLVAAHPDLHVDEEDSFDEQGVWVVRESKPGNPDSREIVFRSRVGKFISEAEGPYAMGCPLYFFELVPKRENPIWRNRVKWFTSTMELSEQESDAAWDAYEAGQTAGEEQQKHSSNPYTGVLGEAWFVGWATLAQSTLPKILWPKVLRNFAK